MAELIIGGDIDPREHSRTGTTTSIAADDLTTHGVIVGMTGSGKTGLGVVLIESCLEANIPTLLIDPKGDLTNLGLMFPGLSGPEFEPWVNEGDAAKAGQTVAEFAVAQAAAWSKGLATWGITAEHVAALRARTDIGVYTPGSTAGLPLNIVGSLDPPAGTVAGSLDSELVSDEIEGIVSGLLALVGITTDPLSGREHILLSNLILHAWTQGHSLDLATLIGWVQSPPLRKLGVFELDQFFPPADRTKLAMQLNGLLASPSFGTWMQGTPIDINSMLHTPDGRARCAIITTSHLSDDERQFVTTLVLSKLVTWMRRQSGTSNLRALLYMDEVVGYLPPSAAPPTKKPIMTLLKQARAFGVGVVLSTQNPVDVDYKALSNAGTWMIGRLQTERDKQRLLDGMSAASGGVDVRAVGDTISGLGKREFVLRRAGKDQPEVFTTRWAMSYLRGPMTRDQIATLMAPQKAAPAPAAAAPGAFAPPTGAPTTAAPTTAATPAAPPAPPAAAAPASPVPPAAASPATPSEVAAPAAELASDATPVMPEVATGIPVRWVDIASPWLRDVGGDSRATSYEAAIVARVALRYTDTKAELLHDEEYETVFFPLGDHVDATTGTVVDYDDRDLRADPPAGCQYRISGAPLKNKTFYTGVERGLVDYLARSQSFELLANKTLKLYSRPGESAEEFARRCRSAADDAADTETSKLRTKYETKAKTLKTQLDTAEDRVAVVDEQRKGRRNEELLSAGSVLGGLLTGRRSTSSILGKVLGGAGSAAGRRSRAATANERLKSAQNKVESLNERIEDLEAELTEEVSAIGQKWAEVAEDVTPVQVPLKRTAIKVTQLVLAWVPVS